MEISLAYQILGVKAGSTKEEIKKAYKEISTVIHPDLHGDKSERFKGLSQLVNTAYKVASMAIGTHAGTWAHAANTQAYTPSAPNSSSYTSGVGNTENGSMKKKVILSIKDIEDCYSGKTVVAKMDDGGEVEITAKEIQKYDVYACASIYVCVYNASGEVVGTYENKRNLRWSSWGAECDIRLDTEFGGNILDGPFILEYSLGDKSNRVGLKMLTDIACKLQITAGTYVRLNIKI